MSHHTKYLERETILGLRVDPLSLNSAVERILSTAKKGDYVCAANVHMTMEAFDNFEYQRIVNKAFMVTPDGMPLVWFLRMLGNSSTRRVYGPDLMLSLCAEAESRNVTVGFFGSTNETLEELRERIQSRFPLLGIKFCHAPPFRTLTEEEDQSLVDRLNSTGVDLLFVGLGCPKQEYWMHNHSTRVGSIMIGVGAAFDFIAGVKKQAPVWMQKAGLEWLFRLLTEPVRLWKRYLIQNPRFIYHFGKQLLQMPKNHVPRT